MATLRASQHLISYRRLHHFDQGSPGSIISRRGYVNKYLCGVQGLHFIEKGSSGESFMAVPAGKCLSISQRLLVNDVAP